MSTFIISYKKLEKDNKDQWFSNDEVGGLIHAYTLIHDRCYEQLGSKPWPRKIPEGNIHVGQDV